MNLFSVFETRANYTHVYTEKSLQVGVLVQLLTAEFWILN